MKIVSDALAAIAVTLDIDYVRTMSETEADVYIHNLDSDKILMIYNGASDIATSFDGAMIIDTFDCQLIIVTKKTQKELSGAQIDELLELTKRVTDNVYAQLNLVTATDIQPYTATAVEVFTDAYVGHDVTIGIPFYNAGCTPPTP